MKIIRSLEDIPAELRGGALSIGNFDGVHLGHARIMQRLLAGARLMGGPAIAFTFEPHPVQVLRPHAAPPPVTLTSRKAELLAELGIDAMIVCPTDEAFLSISPRQFFDDIVRRRLDAQVMAEGTNFFFGHDRAGNIETLREFCGPAGIKLEVIQPVEVDGQVVSSSRVRRLIGGGRIDEVGRLLTRPYRVRGRVVHGAGRGRGLGYPTADLEQVRTLFPGEGIYAGRVPVDGGAWPAAISLGPNPTFGEGALKFEVHLIDYSSDLYERDIDVDFISRLRNIETFRSVEELIVQMDRDIAKARQIAITRAA